MWTDAIPHTTTDTATYHGWHNVYHDDGVCTRIPMVWTERAYTTRQIVAYRNGLPYTLVAIVRRYDAGLDVPNWYEWERIAA